MDNIHKKGVAFFVLVLFLVLVSFTPTKSLEAFSLSSLGGLIQQSQPFGGQLVLPAIPCTCSMEQGDFVFALFIGPPSSGTYLLKPLGMTMYRNFNFYTPGTWLLGTYKADFTSTCSVGYEPYCYYIPITKGVISSAGSS